MPADLDNSPAQAGAAAVPLIGLLFLGVIAGAVSALLSALAGYGLWVALGVYCSTGASTVLLLLLLQILKSSPVNGLDGADNPEPDARETAPPPEPPPGVIVLIGREGPNAARLRATARAMEMAILHLTSLRAARGWFSDHADSFAFIVFDEMTLSPEEIAALRAARHGFAISGPFVQASDALRVLSQCTL